MEVLVPIIALIVAGVSIATGMAGANDWKHAATQLGLEYHNGFQRKLSGTIDDFFIRIHQQKDFILIKISGNGIIRKSITLSREHFLSGVLSGRDIEIGCPNLDPKTFISSTSRDADAEVAALLDHKTRTLISSVVVASGSKVSDGNISNNKTRSISAVPPVLAGMIALAKRLEMKSSEIHKRLAHNARHDRLSSVKLRNLTLLQERFPDSGEARKASAALLTDGNQSIKLAAGIFLGEEGLDTVQFVALDERATTDIRIKALKHLLAIAPTETVAEIATLLLQDKDTRLKRMGIQCLGQLQHQPSVKSLIPLLDPMDPITNAEVIKAIGQIGDPTAEPTLIKLLDASSNRIRTLAIEALGHLGTINAVEPLHALTRERGIKRAARIAIASIQSRLGDAEAGRLSLAPSTDPEGALSLTGNPEKEGGLSLQDSPDES